MSYFAKKLLERAAEMMFFWLNRRQIIPMTMLNWKQHSHTGGDRKTLRCAHTHTHCKTDREPFLKAIRNDGVSYRFSDIHFTPLPELW
jgi:hypothetical protein